MLVSPYRVMFLAGFIHTLSLQADAPLPTGCSLHSWQLLGQTHHLSLANHCTPQPRAYVHAWADCVLRAKRKATLADSIIALPWQLFRAQQGLTRRVQETFSCGR